MQLSNCNIVSEKRDSFLKKSLLASVYSFQAVVLHSCLNFHDLINHQNHKNRVQQKRKDQEIPKKVIKPAQAIY